MLDDGQHRWRATADCRAPVADLRAACCAQHRHALSLGVAPSGIDRVAHVDGWTCLGATRTRSDVDGQRVPGIDPADGIRHQLASGRHHVVVDIASLAQGR
jgi:hypothetical protein